MAKNPAISRRSFIKSGAILSIGAVLTDDPNLKFLSKALGMSKKSIVAQSFACELFRVKDLLQLKFYFFNATRDGLLVKKATSNDYPLFIYCQVPPQHIGEELVITKFKSRAEAKRKKSFLSGPSWLAFKVLDVHNGGFNIDPEQLMDWDKYFELVTLDGFANRSSNTYTGYQQALSLLKPQFYDQQNPKPQRPNANQHYAKDGINWPLTTFEIPYKLFLSPIAKPLGSNETRIFGEHVFIGKNKADNLLSDNFREDGRQLQVYKPWSNELVFKTFDNQVFSPRFKAVHYLCPDPGDKDNNIELLPAPVHREEILELTMDPLPDRDIKSEMFLISATGVTTNLLYKNDFPKAYSTVAWEQRIAEGRDNYVSITFRAVDVFTGLKLKVSIVAERAYDFGISYLPKLYYVSYAEDKKNYQTPATISKVPFVEVIPKTKGAYFEPVSIGTDLKGYVVSKEGTNPPGTTINCNDALSFDYIGIDKDGNAHNFQSKIIFIPAETFEIVTGIYNYRIDGKVAETYNISKKAISIKHIGLLNPAYRQRGADEEVSTPRCAPLPGDDVYVYKIYKTFSDKARLDGLLAIIKAHVLANSSCYEQTVLGEVTYARITALKNSKKMEIRPDSTASSFETDRLLLFSVSGVLGAGDNFLQDFPLIPKLEYSNVVISQINQIEGKNVYRKVEFAKDYADYGLELDEPNDKNKVKLLFKLVDKPRNFFSENYKSAGAVVNPGIDISHISILDQGITYNEKHNETYAAKKFDGVKIETFNSASIFQNVDAKILGIPILAILEDMLPVEDLPAFSYLKDAQDTVKKLEELAGQYIKEFEAYRKKYEGYLSDIESYRKQLRHFDQLIGRMSKDMLRSLIETIVEESGAIDFYESQKAALNGLTKEYEGYVNTILVPVKGEIVKAISSVNIDAVTDVILKGAATYADLTKLYSAVNTFTGPKIQSKEEKLLYLKEAVKIYAIQKTRTAAAGSVYNIQQALLKANKITSDVEEALMAYHTAMLDGLQEAALFAESYVAGIIERGKEKLEKRTQAIAGEVAELLDKAGLKELFGYIGTFMQLVKIYEDYRQFFSHLKAERYKQLYTKLGLGQIPDVSLNAIEQQLIKLLTDEIAKIELPQNAKAELKTEFTKLKTALGDLKTTAGGKYKAWLSNYEEVGRVLQVSINSALNQYTNILNLVDNEYFKLLRDIVDWKKKLADAEAKVKNFVQGIIEEYELKLQAEKDKIIAAAKGSTAYINATSAILKIQQLIKKLREFSKQSIDYQYSTKKFRNASLGVIEFLPDSSTELEVKVNYQIELNINPMETTPSITKQSFITNSSLSNFRLGLMQFIYIDFERVKFISGSEVNEEFVVKIRDVQFAGMLSFVQAFQEYLKTIDDNLVFDIDSSGVRVGYGFAIPDFPAGYFNFFNLSFTGLLTLPFDPKKSLQLMFGIGSDLNKFGITVMGIFGGQGYFNIIAEVGRGIVGMVLVLEFGAIYQAQFAGVAKGTAYLVGGIYIRKYYDNFLLKGYILCVGRFDIICLFSASLSFYLGLEYDGNELKGSCQITATKKFSRFFEISVRVRMDKTISGAKSQKNNSEQKFAAERLLDKSVEIEDTNLDTNFSLQEEPYLNLKLPEGYQNITTELVQETGIVNKSIRQISAVKSAKKVRYAEVAAGNTALIGVSSSEIKNAGRYTLNVKSNGELIFSSDFDVVTAESIEQKFLEREADTVSAVEYYQSYF